MSKEIDRKLLVRPDCLMFFCDDTGHGDFRDPQFPLFGIGACAIMAGAIDHVLTGPWRSMKAEHFGGPAVASTRARSRLPRKLNLTRSIDFFASKNFVGLE
jgi:hypothetical protein